MGCPGGASRGVHPESAKHGDRLLGEIGEVAGADQRLLPARDIGFALRPDLGDRLLDQPGLKRLGRAAGALDLLKQAPSLFAELPGEIFDGAGARGGIGDAMEI